MRGRHAEGLRNDGRVLEAARDVFTKHGLGAPVAAVAQQAGVGIGSLYRRYGSKQELLQLLCVLAMKQVIDAAQLALADADAWRGLTTYIHRCVVNRSGALAPVAGSVQVTEEMEITSERARTLGEKVIERAHTSGDLRSDATAVDIALLIELFSRRVPIGGEELDDIIRDRLLAVAVAGLRAPSQEPLPGYPIDFAQYAARWTSS